MGFNKGIGKVGEKPGIYSQPLRPREYYHWDQAKGQPGRRPEERSSREKRNRKNQHTVFQWVFQEFSSNHPAEQPLRGSFSPPNLSPTPPLNLGLIYPVATAP